MKICMWGAAVLLLTGMLLTGTAARAVDEVGAGGQGEVSVLSAENLATETALTATLFPGRTGPTCVASDWQQFRHGYLWDDYCLQKQVGMAVCPQTEYCPAGHRASWLRTLWPWRSAPEKPCRTCRKRRTPALDALCNLLGWKRCATDRVACHERIDCLEPAGSTYIDDPAPLPPAPPLITPDEPPGGANTQMGPKPSESPPVEPVPIPEETLDPDEPSGDLELAPSPEDDPAPEPQPEIPRNKLPKPQPASPGTSRATSGRTVVAVRLSDYIRTR